MQKHTHTHCVTRDILDGWSLRRGSDTILTHVGEDPSLIKLMSYEHWEDAMGGAGKGKHIHTHTHSVPRDTQDGWSLGKNRTQD